MDSFSILLRYAKKNHILLSTYFSGWVFLFFQGFVLSAWNEFPSFVYPFFRDLSWALSFVKKPTSSLPVRIRCFLYYAPKLSRHMAITLCFNNSYFHCYCHCLNPHLHHCTLISLIYRWCLGYLCVLIAYFITGPCVSFLLL